jgi:Bacterial Ig-like domain
MLLGLTQIALTKSVRSLTIILSVFLFMSCASRGTPEGGKYDLDPPKLVSINPEMNALNVTHVKNITLVFDENVQLENPSEKVIITPPQKVAPIFTTINRKIKVEIRDTLIPNSTYVMDFTDALADMNEKNVLENFVASFSTGNRIDSLEVSGKVLQADDLEPVSGIYVGLHSSLSDSAFVKLPFDRISKTNSKGEFTIRGVTPNKYRLFALKDANRDFKYDSPAEQIAFLDSLIVPSSMPATRVDTVFKADKKTVDSLVTKSYTRFLPEDIILRSFTSSFKRQFLQKYERPNRNNIVLYFGGPTQRPRFELLKTKPNRNFPLLEERAAQNDTVKYWITDPEILKNDSLLLRIGYIKTDSLNIGRETTDTIKLNFREFKGAKKNDKGKDKDKEEIRFLGIKTNASGSIDILQTLNIEFEEPVLDFDQKKFVLSHVKDSVLTPIPYTLLPDSLNPRRYKMAYKWKPGEDYVLHADSAAFHSYYGLWNNKLDGKFKVKKEEEYGHIYLNIKNLPQNVAAFVELLDRSDKPIRRSKVKDSGALFKYVNPGTYYARLVIDSNNNGKWDTGEYADNRQPEMVYYLHKSILLKAYFEMEEDFDLTALALDKQKLLEITKNKPQQKKTKRQQLEEAEKKKQSKNNSSSTASSNSYSDSTNNDAVYE